MPGGGAESKPRPLRGRRESRNVSRERPGASRGAASSNQRAGCGGRRGSRQIRARRPRHLQQRRQRQRRGLAGGRAGDREVEQQQQQQQRPPPGRCWRSRSACRPRAAGERPQVGSGPARRRAGWGGAAGARPGGGGGGGGWGRTGSRALGLLLLLLGWSPARCLSSMGIV